MASPNDDYMPHPEWEAHKKLDLHVSVSRTSAPVAPFSRRAPSPPLLNIPAHSYGVRRKPPSLSPSYRHIDASLLPLHDAKIITRDAIQQATNSTIDWKYEHRREAQRVLDFVYLGPIQAIRDHAYLEREGITMLVIAQDCQIGFKRLMTVDKAAEALDLEVRYLGVNGSDQLVSAFPDLIRTINDHLLAMHHAKVMDNTLRRGKVLIACETGNYRSAAIVVAYIMAVYGQKWILACQFVSIQRFCVVFDEEIKLRFLTWQGILEARAQVSAALNGASMAELLPLRNNTNGGKRRTEDTDDERFTGRDAFVPFMDES